MKAVSDPLRNVLDHLNGVKQQGSKYIALCPAHDDHNPSLGIREGDDGIVLVYCYAGCDIKDIVKAAGLRMNDLFLDPIAPLTSNRSRPSPPRLKPATPKQRKRVATMRLPKYDTDPIMTYEYRATDGALVRVKARYITPDGKKDFRWFSPAGDDGWYTDKDEAAPETLYGAEHLVTQPAADILLTESEKDKDALEKLELLAVAAGGADNWHPAMADQLAGCDVAILTHNDESGRTFARQAAADLVRVGSIVRDVRLPGLPEKGDVVDWLDGGGTKERLIAFVAATAPVEPDIDDADDEKPRRFRTFTIPELMTRPPLEYDIEKVLPRNALAALIARSGHFKTFLALDFSLHMACGKTWHGHAVRRGGIVYVSAEGSANLHLRIEAWLREYSREAPMNFRVIADAPQLLAADDVDALIATILDTDAPPSWIIIDTLPRVFAGEENSSQHMGQLVAAADRIRRETGSGVMFLHHPNKTGDSARGSNALLGALDVELTLTREGDNAVLRITKAKDFEEGEPISLRTKRIELPNEGSSLILEQTDHVAGELTGTQKRVGIILLETFGDDGATATQWQEACESAGIDRTTYYSAKTKLLTGAFINPPPESGKHRGWHFTVTEKFLISTSVHSKYVPNDVPPWSVSTSVHPPLRGCTDVLTN